MMEDVLVALKEANNVDALREKAENLWNGNPTHRAISYYLSHWLNTSERLRFDPMNLDMFLSADLSTVMMGICPVIFMGTNEWATKRWIDYVVLEQKLGAFIGRAKTILSQRDHNICFLIVPEKDIVIEKIRKKTETIEKIDDCINSLPAALGQANFIYDSYMENLPFWSAWEDYSYPDSHLLSRDYALIAEKIIDTFQLGKIDWERFYFQYAREYGDLNSKFATKILDPYYAAIPCILNVEGRVTVLGSQSFENPLGETKQEIINLNAPFDASIKVYGDSHCSIYSAKKLTFFLSSMFKSVQFEWNPWGVRGGDMELSADFVLMEISQRFVL